MQPSSAAPQYPPPSGFAPPNPNYAGIRTVRAWLVALVATIMMLVLIAAVGNPSVTDKIIRRDFNQSSFYVNVLRSFTVFAWRFSPRGGTDFGHIWRAGLVFVLAVLVLTFLLSWALAARRRGFGGTFLAVWAAVFVAAQVASYLRAASADLHALTNQSLSKPVEIFFAQYSPGAYNAFAALLLGLVTALVAALVGVLSRRTEVIGPVAGPGYPPPAYPDVEQSAQREGRSDQVWAAPPPPGPIASPSAWSENRSGADLTKRADDGVQHTAVLPALDQNQTGGRTSEADATTQLPAYRDEATPRATSEPEPTQAYRLPGGAEREPEATQAYRLPSDTDTHTDTDTRGSADRPAQEPNRGE